MKGKRWLAAWLIALALGSTAAQAQDTEAKNLEAYERLATPLRLQPKQPFNVTKTRLGDAIGLLASLSEISYQQPSSTIDYDKLISFNVELSPFAALESIAKEHDFRLLIKNNVWSVIPIPTGKVRTVHYEHPVYSITSPEEQKQWPDYVSTLFRPHNRNLDLYSKQPTFPIVEIDFSLIQIEVGHDEILLGPQNDGPVTKIIRTSKEKSQLETLLTNPNTRTIHQRKLSLQSNRQILVDHLSSEIIDGAKRFAPDPPPGKGIDLPDIHVRSKSVILPGGTQVTLECKDTGKDSALLNLSATVAGLRKGPEPNQFIDILFAATHHYSAINAPIGEILVVGSFEEHRSPTDILLEGAPNLEPKPNTKTLLLIHPTKVIGLEWAK